jgi:phosphotransferase system HPr-like phosphotransfer protein
MYVEEFRAAGPLTAEIAEDLAAVAGGYRSYITISSNGRTVHAPVLPVCWDVLRVRTGTDVTVTTANGMADEDRLAIRAFVDRFQTSTGSSNAP